MSRLSALDPARLSPPQAAVYQAIAAAHNGQVRGPWAVELRVPEVAEHMHALYDRLCVQTKLGKRLFELMVLVVARHWNSEFEWFAHEPQALGAGLAREIVDAIRERRTPPFVHDDERLVYDVITELNEIRTLSRPTYDRALAALGEELLVELIAGAGTYSSIAMQLNAFGVEIPAGTPPLKDSGEPAPLRRIITGHDRKGVAKVLTDTTVTNVKRGLSGSAVMHVWNTDRTPADIALGEEIEDVGARPHVTPPPTNGTRMAVIDFPPDNTGAMHRTESVDYVVVMAGEIDMDLDDSTIRLKAGDVLIQRGTNHAWYNRGAVTARVAFVLVDAEPLGIGHPRTLKDA